VSRAGSGAPRTEREAGLSWGPDRGATAAVESGPRVAAGLSAGRLKPPPDRLYGRSRSHPLRARQRRLLEESLPRLAFPARHIGDPAAAFAPRAAAVWLEVGFGSGEHALATIGAVPGVGLIACEVFENGIAAILGALVPAGAESEGKTPGNIRLWDSDARGLIRALPAASVSRLFLLFPDPWPKARHAKRRFVHPLFLPAVARLLAPSAEWRIATDDPVYQAWVAEVLAGQDFFAVPPPAEERPADWPPTRYEAKARAAGRPVLYWRLVRRGGPGAG
jgi:tRNA (guanine-N7-)-methyltransferase